MGNLGGKDLSEPLLEGQVLSPLCLDPGTTSPRLPWLWLPGGLADEKEALERPELGQGERLGGFLLCQASLHFHREAAGPWLSPRMRRSASAESGRSGP